MKTRMFLVALIATMGISTMVFTSCKSKKQAIQQPYQTQPKPGVVEDEFVEPPCTMYDDDNVFVGSSSAYGSAAQEAVIRRAALTNAQNIARQKMKHAYQGMVSDYFNLIGNNAGNTARSNIEGAGDQIIDIIVNDTKEKCIRRSKTTDAKGNITYYIGIEIDKKAAADKISDALSKDDELDIRFQEYNYREKMKEKFKEYKEEQKK
jgi:hypothetical protein